MENGTRFIGIRHRVKKIADGEAHPTQVVIAPSGQPPYQLDLETEQDELDFVFGLHPVAWRKPEPDQAFPLGDFPAHHRKYRKVKDTDDIAAITPLFLKVEGKDKYVLTGIPSEYDGLRKGDVVGMALGGSGDRFAYGLSRQAGKIGAAVLRIPPFALKQARGGADKNQDAHLLVKLVETDPSLFYPTLGRDRSFIAARVAWQGLQDSMKARIAAEQRLRQRFIGRIFCSESGGYPQGALEDEYAREKANDRVVQALETEEKDCEKKLVAALDWLDVYTDVFSSVEGCGPRIAGRIVAAVINIARFRVLPDQTVMEALKRRAEECERNGHFERDKDKIADRIVGQTTFFQILQMVRSWKRQNGLEEEAVLLDEAISCHQQRGRLRRKAHLQSRAKFRYYCGVGLTEDGQFLRRRSGKVANWSNDTRQALYLFADQMNRRPNSEWGRRLLDNKASYAAKHPEVVKNEGGKKRYTKGHIANMARWKTLAEFCDWFYDQWTLLDRKAGSDQAAEADRPQTPAPAPVSREKASVRSGDVEA